MNPTKTVTGLNYLSFPISVTLFHDESIVLNGNAISITNSTQYYGNQQCVQDPPALLDAFYHPFMIYPGNYTLTIYGTRANNNGIFSIYIDEYFIGTVDWYDTTTHHPYSTSISVTIQDAKTHNLKFVCTGKNASSSDYHGVFYKFIIQ